MAGILQKRFGDAAVHDVTCWQAGDSPSISRPNLHGFVLSLGHVGTSIRCLPPTVVVPPLSQDVREQLGCESALNVLLPLLFVRAYTEPGDVVADFMCGSGSCALAAACTGRHSVSVDFDRALVAIVFISHENALFCALARARSLRSLHFTNSSFYRNTIQYH